MVLDLSLGQIANTLVPYGTALPKTGDLETPLRAIASKSPQEFTDMLKTQVNKHQSLTKALNIKLD